MHCEICWTRNDYFKDAKRKSIYYICYYCQFISKDPKVYPNFETQETRYNLHQNKEDDVGYQAYFQKFLDFTLPLLKEEIQDALDFGCGRTSLLAQMLEKKNITCDYYDPIYHPNILQDNKCYDLIVSTEVFEHLHKPKEVFASLVGKLNPKGYLAIQTAFHPNDNEKFKTWYYPQDSTHIVFFTPKTFEVLSKMYGCKVIKDNDKNMIVIQKI
ncbi:Methyltransferase-related protein [hydrothermal vent metagenome]|uniref:Methyltransferase-related protein n=1 Tax=hydrothermal vent metagenome TaxID=652676 RepID=A0A1W1CX59_9ZZZZ